MIRTLFPRVRKAFSYNIGSLDKFHTPRLKVYMDKTPPKVNLDALLKNPETYKSMLQDMKKGEEHLDQVILLLNGIQRHLQESFVSYQLG